MRKIALLILGIITLWGLQLPLEPRAFGSESIAETTKLSCTSCHVKPGSRRLTDQGKYFELRRTTEGYDQLKATFGRCTSCHVAKPGSHRLTRQGREFKDLVRDMEGLAEWMRAYHPEAHQP